MKSRIKKSECRGHNYDSLNNPVRIQFTDGNVTKYVYSAAGEKLRVIYKTAVPNISVAIGSTRELTPYETLYTDSIDYLLGGALTLRNGRIDKFQFDEGYCQAERYTSTKDDFTFCYYDKDHLGNVRQVTELDGSRGGIVIQRNNYYPFGAEFCDNTASNSVQSRKYNGKEFDRMHGLNTYDYGARQYNPVTARWDRQDLLAEKYYGISPYVYCMNNPVKFVDPDGCKPTKKEAAMIAADVYEPRSKACIVGGWRRVTTGAEIVLNDKGTGLKSAVYGRWDSKKEQYTEFVYATAGTDLISLTDWKNNIEQLLGDSEQYEQSISNARILNKYYSNSELTFVGHSLGGGLASANSLATGRDAITFNAAGLSDKTKDRHNLNKKGRIDAYVVNGEALSIAQAQIGMQPEGLIHSLDSWSMKFAEFCTNRNSYARLALSLWKHSMDCVKTLLK